MEAANQKKLILRDFAVENFANNLTKTKLSDTK